MKKLFAALLVVAAAAIMLLLLTGKAPEAKSPDFGKINLDENVKPFVESFSGYQTDFKVLDAAEIKGLAQKFPIIYGGLQEAQYFEIRYTSPESGLLIVADSDSNVIRVFDTSQIVLDVK